MIQTQEETPLFLPILGKGSVCSFYYVVTAWGSWGWTRGAFSVQPSPCWNSNPTMPHTVCLKSGKLEFIDIVKQQVAIQFKFTGKILKNIIQFGYSMLLPKMQIN